MQNVLTRAAARKSARQLLASLHWPVASAMVLVGAFTLASKITVVAKEALVAKQFGTGDALDAFFIAFLVPSFAVSVIGGSLSSAFLPAYVQVRDREGQSEADRLLGSVVTCAGVLLVGLAVLCITIGLPLIHFLGADFGEQKLQLTRLLFYVLLPMLVIGGISAIWAAALNASGRFAVVAAAPIITPIVVVAALLWVGRQWGIYAVAAGTVAGALGEALLIGLWLARQRQRLVPAWFGMTPAVRQVLHQLAPMIAAGLLMSSSSFIDQSMAARLGPGSVSSFNYGSRLVTGLLGIASVALGTAVFPHFARLIARRDLPGAISSLKAYALLILAVSIPLLVLVVHYSPVIIRLLFERGSFTSQDTSVVSSVQAFSALQIPFYLIGLLGVRFISSLQGNQVLVLIGVVNVATNVAGNVVLSRIFGVSGIALSTTLVYALSCVLIMVAIRRLLRSELNR